MHTHTQFYANNMHIWMRACTHLSIFQVKPHFSFPVSILKIQKSEEEEHCVIITSLVLLLLAKVKRAHNALHFSFLPLCFMSHHTNKKERDVFSSFLLLHSIVQYPLKCIYCNPHFNPHTHMHTQPSQLSTTRETCKHKWRWMTSDEWNTKRVYATFFINNICTISNHSFFATKITHFWCLMRAIYVVKGSSIYYVGVHLSLV